MAYNRPPYQPYDDTDPNQPYPIGYPAEIQFQEEYPQSYDVYNNYQTNPTFGTSYPEYQAKRPDRFEFRQPLARPTVYDEGKYFVPHKAKSLISTDVMFFRCYRIVDGIRLSRVNI